MKKLYQRGEIFWSGSPERAYCVNTKILLNGHYESYHESGKLRYKGSWINGMKEGAWQYFYKEGQLFSRGFYKIYCY